MTDGGMNMKTVNISLLEAQSVKTFVNAVAKYPYEIDLRAGRHVVDAKSILGIFSLDLSKTLTLEIYGDDCDQLLAEIAPFIVK
jgi:phosphotransferase system HPr-like phosphotransfer protein